MVAKLVRSSRVWSLVVFGVLSLGVLIGVSHFGNPPRGPVAMAQGGGGAPDGATLTAGKATTILVNTPAPTWCANKHSYCTVCPEPGKGGSGGGGCGTGKCGGGGSGSAGGSSEDGSETTDSGLPRPGGLTDSLTMGLSVIDNNSLSYVHTASDFSMGASRLHIDRIHRLRNHTEPGSFGPGVFCNYDTKLLALSDEYDYVLLDPTSLHPKVLDATHAEGEIDTFQLSVRSLKYYDGNGDLIPWEVNWPDAETVVLTTWSGTTFTFDLELEVGSNPAVRHGRLLKIQNRNGRGPTLTYKTWTQEELEESPDRIWQIDTVTDAYGNVATFTYGEEQVGGRWAVSQIDLPGSVSVAYAYTDDKLSGVTYPDETTSSFGYDYDEDTQCNTLTFDDAGVPDTHRRKTVYATTGITTGDPLYYNTANLQVRMVRNGDGEVAYMNFIRKPPTGDDETDQANYMYKTYVYEGSGRLKVVDSSSDTGSPYSRRVKFVKEGWSFTENPEEGDDVLTNVTFETNFAAISNGYGPSNWAGIPSAITDARGITKSYLYDSSHRITRVVYPDETFETFCYNDFSQVTRYRDRLGRVTLNSYDARGNLLLKEVGLVDSSENGSTEDPYVENGYNRCATDDVQTDEYATYQWEYYGEEDTNAFLLSASIDANGNRTEYAYDSNHRLISVTEAPDNENDDQAVTQFEYDSAGRLHLVTDPEGHITERFYDSRNRVTQILYDDGTTDRYFYGSGDDVNLLVKSVDRRNVVTSYEYDDSGRRITTTTAAALMSSTGEESAVSDPSVTVEEVCDYLDGTNLRINCVRAGDKTSYKYDYRQRLVETTVYPRADKTLTSKQHYVDAQLFASEDPYGRKKFFAYDATDGRLIRQIQGTVPSVSYDDFADVLNAERDPDGTPNSTSLITDYLFDAEGQMTSQFDGRGIEHRTSYDSRGRTKEQIQAFGSDVAAKTQTLYDSNSNVTETRTPRYFDSNDTEGYEKSRTPMTYTGRNKLKSRTEAPGTDVEATESFGYDLSGRQTSHTDFRGNTWLTQYPDCCGRARLTIDPLGHGTITHTDPVGNVTHTATVADVSSHTDHLDPIDNKTYREVTTKYDERGRPVASTTWLVARGTIDPSNPPIAGENSISAEDGLTTRYQYDDHLTDETGLDDDFSTHLTGLSFDENCDGSGRLITNPAGERTLAFSDGTGRGWRTVQLGAMNEALTQSTQTYDALVAVANYGDVLETSFANLLGNTNRSRSDGAGRAIQSVDAEDFVASVQYDANGNRLSIRDPNSVGQDCEFDELNRDIQCADTQEIADSVHRSKAYNFAGQVIQETDAKNNSTTHAYDARGRKSSTTDRISATTVWTYDEAGNELSMTDAEDQTTSYTYDTLGRRVTIQWPDHEAMTSPGDSGYGIQATAYDPAGRVLRKTDQKGDTITLVYDLAGRMTSREYRTLANSPSGTVADHDDFTYDAAGRILTAAKGRYANTVTLTYNAGGRKATESLAISGQTYTIGYTYDEAGREATITYPDGSVVTRDYTDRGQLEEVAYTPNGGMASTIASFTYDDGRRETSRALGNGLTTSRGYQADNLVTSIATPNLETLAYTYDANKNPTAEVRSGTMSDYSWSTGMSGFDNQNRLTDWSRTNGDAQSWTLTPVNDWEAFTNNMVTQNRTHGAAHEITAIDSTSLTHDNRGNLTQDERGTAMTYDADNMLSAFDANSVSGLKDATYQHDALGRRVAKAVDQGMSNVTTVYVLANQQVIAEYIASTSSTDPERKYAYATYIDEPLILVDATDETETLAYFHANRQYSTYALTDGSGTVLEFYAYTPYGSHCCYDSMAAGQGTTPQRGHSTLFTGREYDNESHLYNFRTRMFDGIIGRFFSRDAMEYPDGGNTYASWFCPSSTDPTGEISVTLGGTRWTGSLGCVPLFWGICGCITYEIEVTVTLCDCQKVCTIVHATINAGLYVCGTTLPHRPPPRPRVKILPVAPGGMPWPVPNFPFVHGIRGICPPDGCHGALCATASIGIGFTVGCRVCYYPSTGSKSWACGTNIGTGTGVSVGGGITCTTCL